MFQLRAITSYLVFFDKKIILNHLKASVNASREWTLTLYLHILGWELWKDGDATKGNDSRQML